MSVSSVLLGQLRKDMDNLNPENFAASFHKFYFKIKVLDELLKNITINLYLHLDTLHQSQKDLAIKFANQYKIDVDTKLKDVKI